MLSFLSEKLFHLTVLEGVLEASVQTILSVFALALPTYFSVVTVIPSLAYFTPIML